MNELSKMNEGELSEMSSRENYVTKIFLKIVPTPFSTCEMAVDTQAGRPRRLVDFCFIRIQKKNQGLKCNCYFMAWKPEYCSIASAASRGIVPV